MNDDTPSLIQRGLSAGQDRTDLYKLFYKHLPNHRLTLAPKTGNEWRGVDIRKISNEIGVSQQKISEWLKRDRIPGQRVNTMMKLAGSTLTYDLLGPFINTR